MAAFESRRAAAAGRARVVVREDAERLRERLRLSNAEGDRLEAAARTLETLHGLKAPPALGDLRALLFERGRHGGARRRGAGAGRCGRVGRATRAGRRRAAFSPIRRRRGCRSPAPTRGARRAAGARRRGGAEEPASQMDPRRLPARAGRLARLLAAAIAVGLETDNTAFGCRKTRSGERGYSRARGAHKGGLPRRRRAANQRRRGS